MANPASAPAAASAPSAPTDGPAIPNDNEPLREAEALGRLKSDELQQMLRAAREENRLLNEQLEFQKSYSSELEDRIKELSDKKREKAATMIVVGRKSLVPIYRKGETLPIGTEMSEAECKSLVEGQHFKLVEVPA